ncbi:MAG TPA: hypothetical protein VMH50_13975 [Thermoleophilia bacterium]|nr:hypothetical protein [Thermoleophilia bacterium]
MPDGSSPAARTGRLLGWFCGYAALAVAATYPLAAHLADGVPHDLFDPLLNTWLLWWNARALPFSGAWWNGPFFHPLPGVLSFSENLVGLSPLTTPLQWLGASPLAAYNVAFLLSFAGSAFTMHLLCRSLGMRSAACAFAGLAYAFAPYRAGHLAHLQVLSAELIPLVFLGLHRFLASGRRRWLLLFAACWGLQGLTNGYYLVFVSVLVGLWLLWFAPPGRDTSRFGLVCLAWVAAGLALAPVLREYSRWHAHYGFERRAPEIEGLSADLLGLVSPPTALAHWPAAAVASPEGWLFPGLTLPLVVGAFLATRTWRTRSAPLFATVFAAVAALAATVAAITAITGPWHYGMGRLSISVTALHKPLAVSLYALVLAGLSSHRLREAWRRRSALTFYLLASVAMTVLALGPLPCFAGMPVWDKAPYWYLLRLPGVSALRVPARFAMLAVFCLVIAGALVLERLVERRRRLGTALTVLAAASALWEGWPALPVVQAPQPLRLSRPEPVAAVLELPLDGDRDTCAMFRAMGHGLPIVNGYSGYVPPHYYALQLGLKRKERGVLGALREQGSLLVLLDRSAPRARGLERLLLAEAGARQVGEDGPQQAYLLPRTAPDPPRVLGARLALHLARDSSPGRAIYDLGEPQPIGSVRLDFGQGVSGLPPRVVLETADALHRWTTVWDGPVAGLALRGALRDPHRVPVVLETPGACGRFLSIRVEPWIIQEVAVFRPRS